MSGQTPNLELTNLSAMLQGQRLVGVNLTNAFGSLCNYDGGDYTTDLGSHGNETDDTSTTQVNPDLFGANAEFSDILHSLFSTPPAPAIRTTITELNRDVRSRLSNQASSGSTKDATEEPDEMMTKEEEETVSRYRVRYSLAARDVKMFLAGWRAKAEYQTVILAKNIAGMEESIKVLTSITQSFRSVHKVLADDLKSVIGAKSAGDTETPSVGKRITPTINKLEESKYTEVVDIILQNAGSSYETMVGAFPYLKGSDMYVKLGSIISEVAYGKDILQTSGGKKDLQERILQLLKG